MQVGRRFPVTCESCGTTYESEQDEGCHIESMDTGDAMYKNVICESCGGESPLRHLDRIPSVDSFSGPRGKVIAQTCVGHPV